MSRPLLISLLLLVFLVYCPLFLLPKYQSFQLLRAEINQTQQELDLIQDYLSHLKDLSRELKSRQKELLKIEFGLPPDPEIASLFDFLQKIAPENGLILKSLSHSSAQPAKEEGSQLKETSIILKVSGNYNSLLTFLAKMEKSARFIKVSSISFATPPQGEVFDFDISIKVYSY